MSNKKLSLVGFYNRDADQVFSFLIPVFKSDGAFFRFTADSKTGIIEDFVETDNDFDPVPSNAPILNVAVGDEAFYRFQYNGSPYCGNKLKISVDLIKLLKRDEIPPLDVYSICCFLEIVDKIDTCLEAIFKKYKGLNLKKENFYFPEPEYGNLDRLKDYILHFANVLGQSGRALSYRSLLQHSNKKGYLRFNNLFIPKSELVDQFDNLIKFHDSSIYRDLLVHFLKPCAAEFGIKDHPEFRLRLLIDILETVEGEMAKNESLLTNDRLSTAESAWRTTHSLGHIRTHLPKQYKTNELTQMLMSGEPSFPIAIITPDGEYEMRDINDVQRDLIETMSIAKRITEGR